MQTYLFISALLTVVLALAHSVLGEIKILAKIKNEMLPEIKGIPALWDSKNFSKNTIRFVWHVTSVFGLCIAFILLHFSNSINISPGDCLIIKFISITMISAGILTLIISRGAHMGWILFLLIGIFCGLALM